MEEFGEKNMRQLNWRGRVAAMVLACCVSTGFAAPTLIHDPIQAAEKGKSLGVRATVRDAGARVESVSLFYASSRGMSPFRVSMSSSGAGIWYGTIPGHLMGPGDKMLYYIQAENADGETKETDWQTIRLVEVGVAPKDIPSASSVAYQARRQAAPAGGGGGAAPRPQVKSSKAKYLIPAAVIVGGAVAIGGALALADGGGGGGGGGGGEDADVDGNYGGNYDICFEPTSMSNTTSVCDNGLVNVYVTGGSVEIVGLWEADVLTGQMTGRTFSVVKDVAATTKFPEAHLIVSGEINGSICTARIDGYSKDPENPGDFGGRLDTTKR